MKKSRGPFNLNLAVWKGTLETLGGGWNKGNMSMQWVNTMKIMDIKHILKRILTTKLDKVVRIEMKVWEETFNKVMRAIKVLGIPVWMMDIGIGINMNKKLGTMERKPMNHKRA
ncbi:hypothetical protein M9H77_23331 [Catharanthus roseus]|uniref:Uncharacterized protein n=1 Tax=Catharanthus roseus TaxID=4058 RepID=A0ACC0AVY0_CATRO|nr:hypothetical protein M9H77_23331 [Catharanthus roseus]